jgi:hypothetical protein
MIIMMFLPDVVFFIHYEPFLLIVNANEGALSALALENKDSPFNMTCSKYLPLFLFLFHHNFTIIKHHYYEYHIEFQ